MLMDGSARRDGGGILASPRGPGGRRTRARTRPLAAISPVARLPKDMVALPSCGEVEPSDDPDGELLTAEWE